MAFIRVLFDLFDWSGKSVNDFMILLYLCYIRPFAINRDIQLHTHTHTVYYNMIICVCLLTHTHTNTTWRTLFTTLINMSACECETTIETLSINAHKVENRLKRSLMPDSEWRIAVSSYVPHYLQLISKRFRPIPRQVMLAICKEKPHQKLLRCYKHQRGSTHLMKCK